MNKLPPLTAVFSVVFLAANAIAAEVTLENCIQRAVEHNSGLKAFEMSKEAAESNKNLSRASFFPQVKMKARYSLTDQPGRLIVDRDDLGPGLPDQDINLADDHRDNYQASLNLVQPIFTGGSLDHSYSRSIYQLNAAESALLNRREMLKQDVKKIFYEALAAGVQVTSAAKSLEARDKARKITEELRAEGYATREDLLVAEAAVTDAEAKLVQVQDQSDMAIAKLRQLMNALPDEPLEPVGELAKLRIDASLQEFMDDGSARPDIQAMLYQVRQSNEDVAVSKSGYYPNVSLEGGYLRQRETNVADPSVWSVALSAEWNVFDWGKTAAEVKRTSALAQRDSYRLNELKKEASLEIEDLWRQSRAELSRLLSQEARVKSAELVLEQTICRRREGKARQMDVLGREALLWQEYGDYYHSAALLNGIVASLERATAKPLGDLVIRSPLYQVDLAGISERIAAVANIHGTKTAGGVAIERKAVKDGANAEQTDTSKFQSCHLQFGAFSQKVNADRLLANMNTQFASKLRLSIVVEKGMYKVISDSFADKDEALRAVKELGIGTYLVIL